MRLAPLIVISFLGACAHHGAAHHGGGRGSHHAVSPAFGRVAEAQVVDGTGRQIGQARFTQGARGVHIRVDLQSGALSPGWHGAHLHEAGTCADSAAGFKASGAHVKHDAKSVHGLLNREGPEQGDLPNMFAPASGPIAAEFYSERVMLEGTPDKRHAMPLLDADGAALIIHASPDDHMTQPIGGAGARVACAAIRTAP